MIKMDVQCHLCTGGRRCPISLDHSSTEVPYFELNVWFRPDIFFIFSGLVLHQTSTNLIGLSWIRSNFELYNLETWVMLNCEACNFYSESVAVAGWQFFWFGHIIGSGYDLVIYCWIRVKSHMFDCGLSLNKHNGIMHTVPPAGYRNVVFHIASS